MLKLRRSDNDIINIQNMNMHLIDLTDKFKTLRINNIFLDLKFLIQNIFLYLFDFFSYTSNIYCHYYM